MKLLTEKCANEDCDTIIQRLPTWINVCRDCRAKSKAKRHKEHFDKKKNSQHLKVHK